MPGPPEHLGDAGREAWVAAYRSAPWLKTVSILGDLHDERAELVDLVAEHGRTARGSQSQLVDHPHVGQLRQIETEMLKLSAILGVGALNAARLGVSISRLQAKDPTPFEELVARRSER